MALRLERATLRRVAVLEPGGKPLPATEQTSVTLEFALGSRVPEGLDRLLRGELRAASFSAVDDRGRSLGPLQAELRQQEDGVRLFVTALQAPLGIRAIASLQGEMRAYPAARRVRFHIPWLKDEVPLSVEYQGAVATLKRFQLVGSDTTLWVTVQPPAGFRVAPLSQPGAIRAQAMDINGNLVNGGAIGSITQTATDPLAEFRLTAPALRRTPSRLVLDALCVSGEPDALPFRVERVPLPRGEQGAR